MTDAGRRELKDLEGQWKRVCVLGGSKGVGRDVVELLSGRGVEVVALVRREESKKELEKMEGGMHTRTQWHEQTQTQVPRVQKAADDTCYEWVTQVGRPPNLSYHVLRARFYLWI